MNGKREYGDYQTPDLFSLRVCEYLKNIKQIQPSIVIEPTCGTGSFLRSSLLFDASTIIGIETNKEYCDTCLQTISDPRVKIINANFFDYDLSSVAIDGEKVLVIGNPPWVNNSTLSTLNSTNSPKKFNLKGLKGIDAITGASNFDICEYIILQLISFLRNTNATIAMLCKTSVARNIFIEIRRNNTNFSSCDIYEFNAKTIFGIHASACLLLIELSNTDATSDICNIYDLDRPNKIKSSFGYVNGMLHSDISKEVIEFSGKSCFEWRQGVKHDCTKIMELSACDNGFINGLNEKISIEQDYVYPLVKSSMFKSPVIDSFNKYVIVTQKKLHENTSHIEVEAPNTWNYLTTHKDYFTKRKSSIYNGAPEFSMFGIGDYSFSKYKVGLSGFYKKPLFSVLISNDGKPVMVDDTSYFIPFQTYEAAYTAMLLLNSDKVQKYISSIAFLDSKRPYTKKVLEKIDFHAIIETLSIDDIVETEKLLGLDNYFTEDMLIEFKRLPEFRQKLMSLSMPS